MEVRFVSPDAAAETLARWETWLSPAERERAARMVPARRRELLAGHALAREMAAARLGLSPAAVPLTVSENGKPLCPGLWLSIAHSGGAAGCAVSDRPVGLDLERIRAVPPRVLGALAPAERAYVDAGADEADRTRRFWRVWTMKEARLKCRGGILGQLRTEAYAVDAAHPAEGFTFPAAPAGYMAAVYEEDER
jgi:4'-phosphopantetheinyl transferase